MTLSNVKAHWGLVATGTPTRTNSSGSTTIGEAKNATTFSDADIAYSFRVQADSATDVATLTMSSGAVAQTTGTPTITDGGVDFEGKTLPTLVTVYAVLVRILSGTNTDLDLSGIMSATLEDAGDFNLFHRQDGVAAGATTLVMTMNDGTEDFEVVVVGKST